MSKLADKLEGVKTAQSEGVALAKSGQITDVLSWINAPTTAGEMAKALPRGLDESRFARVIQTEIRKNPALLRSEPRSFILAVLTAAQLGLEPGPLGHAYLTGPFRNSKTNELETVLILGYKGLMDLAYRSGTIDILDSVAVHEGEPFKVIRGSEQRIEHVEVAEAQDKKIVAVYAIAFPKGSTRAVFEVMYPAEIEKIRARSKAKDSGPWVTDTEAMWLKTPMRRLLNRGKVRLSVEVAEAIALDEARELGHDRPDVLTDLPTIPEPANGEQGAQPAPAPAEGATEPVQASQTAVSTAPATTAAGGPEQAPTPPPAAASGPPDKKGSAAALPRDQKASGKPDKPDQGKLV